MGGIKVTELSAQKDEREKKASPLPTKADLPRLQSLVPQTENVSPHEMPKKKKSNVKVSELPAQKDEQRKQASELAAQASNTVSLEVQRDAPRLQSSVPRTGDASPKETLQKKMVELKVSELSAQNDESQKQASSSATKILNPIDLETQLDLPRLQSSVPSTWNASPQETAQKMRNMEISELPAQKDELQKQTLTVSENTSNPVSLEPQADFPRLKSSVSPTADVSSLKTLKKKISYLRVSELPAQKDEQQKPAPQSGTKRKILESDDSESTERRVDEFHIYQVSRQRDQVGTLGKKIPLRTNHFPMKINVPGGLVYHYQVNFVFPKRKEIKRLYLKLFMEIINLFKIKYSMLFLNPHGVVFDGRKNIYSCSKLAFESREFEGEIEIKQHADGPKLLSKLILKYVGVLDVNASVAKYCRSGITEKKPCNTIQALNIVLSMTPQLYYETIGRNHFNPNLKDGTAVDLGDGLSLWVGTFTAVRLGWKPLLNVDVANVVSFEESPIVEFIANVLRSNRDYNPSHILLNEKRHHDAVNINIKDLKVQYDRPGGYKVIYRAIKMMPASNKLKVKQNNGEECTIEEYFKNQYNHQLKFPHYPCIHVGKPEKTLYLPIELCTLKKQVLPWFKHLDDNNRQKIIRAAAKPPNERRSIIEKNLRNLSNHYDRDPYANAFGLKVSSEMMKIDGRVLEPPTLKYKNSNSVVMKFIIPGKGKWSPGSVHDSNALKFLSPIDLKYWGVLDLANLPLNVKEQFFNRLHNEGKIRGMFVKYPIYSNACAENLSQVRQTFLKMHDHIKRKNGSAQLIMVITDKKGPWRGELKYLGDTMLKVPTQFVMKPNIYGKDNRGPDDKVLHNLCLKLNHKLGGINHALWKRPPIMNRPVMVMGATVTHPAPSDDSNRPSIAVVVGSVDPNVSQFVVEVRLQHEKRSVEQIVQMENVMHFLLQKFYQKTHRKPEQIIYYRDGVSEGQYGAVLNHELPAIRRACATLEISYEPNVTFIIAQKCHKTRLFVKNPTDGVGKTENIPAGTVVDREITTLSEIDFFLASHEGIQVIIL